MSILPPPQRARWHLRARHALTHSLRVRLVALFLLLALAMAATLLFGMQRALSVANRTSQFVARLDAEILEGMAPEQLEAVADRAWQRRREAAPGLGDQAGGRMDSVLRVRALDVAASRASVEGVLERHAKRWQFEQSAGEVGGEQLLTWALKLKKSVQPTAFVDSVRAAG